jgi:hypothetical protein
MYAVAFVTSWEDAHVKFGSTGFRFIINNLGTVWFKSKLALEWAANVSIEESLGCVLRLLLEFE